MLSLHEKVSKYYPGRNNMINIYRYVYRYIYEYDD